MLNEQCGLSLYMIDASNPFKLLNELPINGWMPSDFLHLPLTFMASELPSYFVFWMSTNYVPKAEFAGYVETQEEQWERNPRAVTDDYRDQTTFTEQMKGFNQTMINQQGQLTRLDDRVIWLEREKKR